MLLGSAEMQQVVFNKVVFLPHFFFFAQVSAILLYSMNSIQHAFIRYLPHERL